MHITLSKVYCFKGVTFSFHSYVGPTFFRRGTDCVRDDRNLSGRVWGLFHQWVHLDPEEQETYRIV